jgi:hypothetical protein
MLPGLLPARIAAHPALRRLAGAWIQCRLALRGGAIVNDIVLIAHAYLDNLAPLLLLHAVLLPLNTYRLARLLRARPQTSARVSVPTQLCTQVLLANPQPGR